MQVTMKNITFITYFVAFSLLFTLTFAHQSFTNDLDHVAEQDHAENATSRLMYDEPSLLLPSQKLQTEGESVPGKETEGMVVSEQRPTEEQYPEAYVEMGDVVVVFEQTRDLIPLDQLPHHQAHHEDEDDDDDDKDDGEENKDKDDDEDDEDDGEEKKKRKEKHHDDEKNDKEKKGKKERKKEKKGKHHKHHKEHKESKLMRKIRKFLAHF